MAGPFNPGDPVVYHRGSYGVAIVVSSGNVSTEVKWPDGTVEHIWNNRLALAPHQPAAEVTE